MDSIFDSVVKSLKADEKIEIRGFGSFRTRQRQSRIGRNPKTGDEVPILPRKVLVFRASHVLKNKINRALTKAAQAAPATPKPPTPAAPPSAPPAKG